MRKILNTTNEYTLSTNQNGLYFLSYFDECLDHENHNYKKKNIQSRITRNEKFIQQYL